MFIEHLRLQFFSTTDAGPEHEFEIQVLMQNLKSSPALSVGCAVTGYCKLKVKQTASTRHELDIVRITKLFYMTLSRVVTDWLCSIALDRSFRSNFRAWNGCSGVFVFFNKDFVRHLMSAGIQIDGANHNHSNKSTKFSGIFDPRCTSHHGLGQ